MPHYDKQSRGTNWPINYHCNAIGSTYINSFSIVSPILARYGFIISHYWEKTRCTRADVAGTESSQQNSGLMTEYSCEVNTFVCSWLIVAKYILQGWHLTVKQLNNLSRFRKAFLCSCMSKFQDENSKTKIKISTLNFSRPRPRHRKNCLRLS